MNYYNHMRDVRFTTSERMEDNTSNTSKRRRCVKVTDTTH